MIFIIRNKSRMTTGYLLEHGKHDVNLIDVLRLSEEKDQLENDSKCLNIKLCLGLVCTITIISIVIMCIYKI